MSGDVVTASAAGMIAALALLPEPVAAQFRPAVARFAGCLVEELEPLEREYREAGAGDGRHALRLVRASDVKPEATDWLWKPRIPAGKLSLLVGDPGTGKSILTCAVAAALTRGAPLPGDDASLGPADVLMISAEDGIADTIRPRLEAAGARLDRVHLVECMESDGEPGHLTLKRPEHLKAIEARVAAIRPTLLIIDPLTAYLGDTDSYEDAKVRGVVSPLAALAERHGCAVLAVMHLRKAGADRALHRVSGSIAFAAAARSVLLAGAEPDQPEVRALVQIKSNLAREAPPEGYRLTSRRLDSAPQIEAVTIEWTGASDLTADRMLARRTDEVEDTLDEAVEFLRSELSGGPVEAVTIQKSASAAGISKASLRRAKDRLAVRSQRAGFGADGAWRWALPIGAQIARAPMENEDLSTYGDPVEGKRLTQDGRPIGAHREDLSTYGDEWAV